MTEYKIVILGAGGVGKSALTVRFIKGNFLEEYNPTIEDSYRKDITVDTAVYSLDIIDTAGQEQYSAMRDQYIRAGDGFILVYSITSNASFIALDAYLSKMYRLSDLSPRLQRIPMVLVGNKTDLEYQREVLSPFALARSVELHCPFLETSAKSGEHVDEVFTTIVNEIKHTPLTITKTKRRCIII